jgi:hypothetical protein
MLFFDAITYPSTNNGNADDTDNADARGFLLL